MFTNTNSNFGRFFWSMTKFVILPAFIIIFVFSNISGKSSVTRAAVATFYPDACLGGFEYPENATGEFSLVGDFDTEDFNRSNSAYIKDRSASIYCGGFQGEIPEDTEAKEFVLTFSWLVEGDGAYEHEEPEPFDSSEESSDQDSDVSEEPNEVLEEEVKEEPTISEDVIEEIKEETEEVEESPKEEPLSEESAPEVSFWNSIFGKYAFAQEEATPVAEDDSADEEEVLDNDEEVKEESPKEEILLEEKLEETSGSPEVQGIFDSRDPVSDDGASPITNGTSEEDEASLDPTAVPSDAFLEVSYTTDGSMWHVLGLVGRSNWQDKSFSIPLHGWEDLENVQVALKTLPTFDETPKVYLDGMKLSVQYEKMSPEEILSPEGNLTVFDPSKGFYLLNISANEIPEDMPVIQKPVITSLDVISFFDRNSPNDTTGIYIFRESDEALLIKEFVGKGNETTYSADSLGDGVFTIIATEEPGDCENKILSECRSSTGFISESNFTVLAEGEVVPINIIPEEKFEQEISEDEEKEELVDEEAVSEPVSDMIDSEDADASDGVDESQ